MTTTIVDLRPNTQLTLGIGTEPLPVDAAGFAAGTVLGTDTAAYQLGDANADAAQNRVLTLPEIANDALADISLAGAPSTAPPPSNLPYATSHDIDMPDGIADGDLIEVFAYHWSDRNTNPATATGYTQRWQHRGAGTYDVDCTKLYKIADGTESGTTLTVSVAGQTIPMGLAVLVTRGVDPANPYDQSEQWTNGNGNVDPDPITTQTDGAVVQVVAIGRKWGGVSSANIPGFTTVIDETSNNYAGLLVGHKKLADAGTENPSALVYDATKTTVVTDALRPASGFTDYTLVVVAASADETASAALAATDCTMVGQSSVQVLTSTLASGTFTITYDGQTTSALAFDSTAAQIATALDALVNLDANDIVVTGGPLDTDDVAVEFVNALADQVIPLLTTSSGDVSVTEAVKGLIARDFGTISDVNVPRAGGTMEPQSFMWALSPAENYEPGREISVDVSDHNGLKSWAAALLVLQGLDTTLAFGATGTEVTGEGMSADLGAITVGARGARVMFAVAKAQVSGSYGIKKNAGTPARTALAASAVGDGMSLDLFLSPPITDTTIDLGPSVWNGNEKYSVGSMELIPAAPPSGSLALSDVLGDGETSTWAEIASAAGDLYEVLEVDTAGLPGDAWISAAYVEFAHSADAAHKIDLVPCGITAAGTVVLGDESAGFAPEPLGTIVEQTTPRLVDLVDSSTLNDYPRMGILVRSRASAVGLNTHKLYRASLVLEVLTGGPVVSNVGGPTIAGNPVTWDYSSAGGHPQTHYQVMVIAGAGQDPDTAEVGNPWSATAGTIVYDSGQVAASDARSLEIDSPLARGDCTYAVRAWASLAGRLVFSDWATATINITGTPPTAPTVATNAALDEDTGTVSVELTMPADATRGFLHRSTDGGTVFEIAGEPIEIGASATGFVVDPDPPFGVDVLYRVGADNGPMTESVWAPENGAEVERFYQPTKWYLQVVADWTLNVPIDVVAGSFRRIRPRISQLTQSADAAAVLSTPELRSTFRMVARVRGKATRQALDVVLARNDELRLVNILGQAWTVQSFGDIEEQLQRWQPTGDETTALSDSHLIPLQFAEISHAGTDTTDGTYPSGTTYPS